MWILKASIIIRVKVVIEFDNLNDEHESKCGY